MLGNCANCSCCHICAAKGISCTPVDKEKVLAQYTEEERKIMEAAAYVEATFYMQYTRIQETAEFARQMGYTKIGLAFCIGISDEAKLCWKPISPKKASRSPPSAARIVGFPKTSLD